MWPGSGKIQHFAYSIKIEILLYLNYKCATYKHLQLYRQWATAFCNAAIAIGNIEGGKLACAHTQNRTFSKCWVFADPVTYWVGTMHWLIHCAMCGYTPCAIDFSWYGTLPCPFTFEDAKLLIASTSAVEWCKSLAHTCTCIRTSFLSILYLKATNFKWTNICGFLLLWI